MATAANKEKNKRKEAPNLLNLNELLDEISRQVVHVPLSYPSRFHFTWQDIHFAGQLLHAHSGGPYSVNLVASLGHIPFSAENKTRRKKLLAAFDPLFARNEFTLSPSSQIQMAVQTDFTGPPSARRVMEAITVTLVDIQDNLQFAGEKLTA